MAFAAAIVNQGERRRPLSRQPAVAKLHQRNETGVEIKAGLGQPVFFATRIL
jgi:hypothetical protein